MFKWLFSLVLLPALGSIVEYKFRQNYGQIFYDYSSSSRHGVNGASKSTTTGDTTATDRGAYFGNSQYITLPSNDAPASAFTLAGTFTITFWLYTQDTDFTLFSRTSSNTNYYFYVQRIASGNQLYAECKVAGSSTGVQTGGGNSFSRNLWLLITISMTSSKMIVYQNTVSQTTSNLPGGGYSESGTYTTRIGDSSASPMMFIWYFIINSGVISPSAYVTTTSTTLCLTGSGTCTCSGSICTTRFIDPDLGKGYMSSETTTSKDAASTTCQPNTYSCAITLSLNCLCGSLSCIFSGSDDTCNCMSLSTGSLTSATCSCITGYSDCNGKCCEQSCSDCANSAPAVCTACRANNAIPDTTGCKCIDGYFGTAPLISISACSACFSECATCTSYGPCLTCVATYATKVTSGNGCACNAGYNGISPLNTAASCYPCYTECSACSSPTKCTSCKADLALPDTTQGCYCPTGTYSTGSPLITAGACVACYEECASCTQSLLCVTCKASLALIHATQGCYCPTGTYSTGSPLITAGACVACYQECASCTQALLCVTCKASLAAIDSPQGCYCPTGTYSTGSPLITAGACVACYEECATCTQALLCVTCKASLASVHATQGCYCPVGTYSTGSPLITVGACVACDQECASCTQASICVTCKASLAAIDSLQGCYCPAGTFSTGSPLITVGACVACYPECASCTQANICTTCKASLASVHATQGCYCPVGTYSTGSPLLTAGACVACYQECATCTQSLLCVTCKASLASVHATQGCYCPVGTYSTGSPLITSGACVNCHQECATCTQSLLCVTCKASLAVIDSTQGCYCPAGTYSTGSPLITVGACVACYPECASCTQDNICTACKASLALIDSTQGCYCPTGTYSTSSPLITSGACMACYEECASCTQSLLCVTCKASLALIHVTQGCYCPTGTYSTGSPLIAAGACVACYQECATCSQANICVTCKASLAAIHATQGCYCPTGTYSTGSPLVTAGACVACYQECASCTQASICVTCKASLALIHVTQGCYCPTGTYSTGSPLITAGACVACYQECASCTQASICATCKASLAAIHATQGCYCPTGTYSTGSPLITAGACTACYQECASCTQSLKCTACKASLAAIHSIQGCYCPAGTYSTGSPLITAGACVACYQECASCTQSLKCTACKASLALIDSTQGCYCPTGTYSTGSPLITAGACTACYQECASCTQSLKCTVCKASLAVIHSIQGCYCPAGTYSTGFPLITAGACVACYQECASCTQSLKCTACKASLAAIDSTQGCYCPTGTYSAGSPLITAGACVACYQECASCIQSLLCVTCKASLASVHVTQGCYCPVGTYSTGSPLITSGACVACYQECATCSQALKCLTCKASLAAIDATQGCYCPIGTNSTGSPLLTADACYIPPKILTFTVQPPSNIDVGVVFSVTVMKSIPDSSTVYIQTYSAFSSSVRGIYGTGANTDPTGTSFVFNGLYFLTSSGSNRYLVAYAIGFTAATSNAISINSQTTANLYFTSQPSSMFSGVALTTGLTVKALLNPMGQLSVDNSFYTISFSLVAQDGSGTLTLPNCFTSSGSCSPSSYMITGYGTFLIKASSSNCNSTYTHPIKVYSGPPAILTLNAVTSKVYKGQVFDVTGTVLDSSSLKVNQVFVFNLVVASGPGKIIQGDSVTVLNGVLSFKNVIINTSGAYSLTLSCPACTGTSGPTPISVNVITSGRIMVNFITPLLESAFNQRYKLSLTQMPTSSVIVSVSSSDSNEVSIVTSSLIFTPTNYYIPQDIYINIGNIASSTNPYTGIKLVHSLISSDTVYSENADYTSCVISGTDIRPLIFGYQSYSIKVNASISMIEDGEATVMVTLGQAPTVNKEITVDIQASSPKISTSVSSLIFTSTSWQYKTFKVSGPPKGTLSSSYTSYTISYTFTNRDPNFQNTILLKYPSSLKTTVVVTKAPPNSIFLSSSASFLESNHYGIYFIWLTGSPTSTVTVTLTSSSPNIVVTPTSVTFTTAGIIAQKISLYAKNISPTVPSYAVTITHTSTSTDPSFNSLSKTHSVTVSTFCQNLPYGWPQGASCSCPAGFDCRSNVPIPCPSGTYNSGSSIACRACPAGFFCANPAAAPVACTGGTYSYEYYTSCYTCPAGFSCVANGYLMKQCLQGAYYQPGGSCATANIIQVSLSPESSISLNCPTGYYIKGASDSCVPCPAGRSCSGITSTACPTGTYSLSGFGTCISCPDHMECDVNLGPHRVCPEGTYRTGTSTWDCVLCPAGSYCSNSIPGKATCPPGYLSDSGASFCRTANNWSNYPGLTQTGTTVGLCDTSANYDCVIGSTYSAFKDNTKCTESFQRCYPIPAGETALGIAATNGKFSYHGSGKIFEGFMGYNLPNNAERPDLYGFECEPGYYCPDSKTKYPCPARTFYPSVRATSLSDCMPCPPGYDCPAGTGDYELYPCPKNCFCNKNFGKVQGPMGYFHNGLRAISLGSFDLCPQGYWCISDIYRCYNGNICPIRSGYNGRVPLCPEGTYNMFYGKYKIEDCILCPAGYECSNYWRDIPYYCRPGTFNPYQGSLSCFPCTAGYACIGYKTITPSIKCMIGYYCPEGSKTPLAKPCPPGTVGTQYGSYSVTQCEKCPPGFYCGYAFNYVKMPPLPCPAGYYCPIGTQSKYQYPCPKGTYSTRTRLEGIHECLTCPKGYFCSKTRALTPAAPTVPTVTSLCPMGYYCPLGSEFDKQYPCPAGTYSAITGATEIGECLMCPIGKYCPIATVTPINCPSGTYMDELGAANEGPGNYPSCKPCPSGYYSSVSGSINCTPAGVGKYSYQGATIDIICPAGHFCALSATSEFAMRMSTCPAGYLCPIGTSIYPSLALACPIGNYCLEGATTATPCEAGTYRNTKGAKSINDCTQTPAGYYTPASGASDYSSFLCQAGYYCPAGSTSATSFACPLGTYRGSTGGKAATDCALCPSGFYCPFTMMTAPTICPATYFCPSGTIVPLQCPKGTYSTSTGLKTSSDCTPCDPGKYCESPGLAAVTGICSAGFYCIGGATLQSPLDGVTGGLCPAGGYCLAGAITPSPCPAGTFNNFQGGYSSSDCVPCWPGYYCLGENNPEPTAQCSAGYYCTGSNSIANPAQASAGYYAPLGSVAQIPCLKGTYNPTAGQSDCLSCPAGAYCPDQNMQVFTTCPSGFYCPQKSFIPTPCPPGTFRLATGGQSADQCSLCSAGMYCSGAGLTSITGICDAGYLCQAGATSSQPELFNAGFYGRCPPGYYCESGALSATACAAGYFNPSSGAEDSSGCVLCPAGFVCHDQATINYSILCRWGYVCNEGSISSQPAGGECPVGSYCPTGSAVSLKCPAGTYQDLTTQSSCKTCPPGYYCPIGTSNYLLYICPAGYYCPAGTTYGTQYPCIAGTFNPYQAQQVAGSCQPCSSGSYCNTNGAHTETGICAPGFYCLSSSITPRPTLTSMGGRCTKGTYCPAGASSPIQCDAGFYCPDDEMSAVGPICSEGYYCLKSSTTSTPTDGVMGNICSKNNYCAAGSSYPSQCNAGTYIPYTGASVPAECLVCIPGYFCDGADPQICPAGYYCPGGDSSPVFECNRGYYCPAGSADQLACKAGTYQDSAGQGSCKPCEAGYYCPEAAFSMTLCSKGYYCPGGTKYSYQYPCPPGTYNNLLGQSSFSACITCAGGSFCANQAAGSPSGLCFAGYYCTSSSITAQPTDGITGNICPEGFYCPEGSSIPIECDTGYYCNQPGLSSPSGLCADGYYCIFKATTATPTDSISGNICPQGSYCLSGSSYPELCPTGTYSLSFGLSDPTMCLSCPYGQYCSSSGLTAPTGFCTNGFFCGIGKDSATPIDGACPAGFYCDNLKNYMPAPCQMGYFNDQTQQASCFVCPSGSYCSGGSSLPVLCPKGYSCPVITSGSLIIGTRFSTEFPCSPGTYASGLGNSVCSQCPQGYQCTQAAQSPSNLCPVNKYCPAGTGYGLICEPGTYNKDYQGLGAASECTPCPAGQFCVDGTISGQCAPGFWCKGGSATPTPITSSPTGQLCPSGHYCPKGTITPLLCPSGKFRQSSGARSESDCTSCPPGSYCVSGITTPFPCTKGHYCPVGADAPISCPIRTYNDLVGADNVNFCKICPAGYFCNARGISKFTEYPCAQGHFCVEGATEPVNCPPGTFTPGTIAASINECFACPGGFYCPANTTNVISCPYGSYCPGGNSWYWPCPPGFLCPKETAAPIPCAPGLYCPQYNRSDPTVNPPPYSCGAGTLCPGGYFDESSCSAGSYFNIAEGICMMCAPGSYSDGSYSTSCQPCDAGYICTGGSTRKDPRDSADNGYPCPTGHYCPSGAIKPIPCPIATYNPLTTGKTFSDCLLCPQMTYGDETGQNKCKFCGSNAVSTGGNTTCACIGKFRFYQKSDGSCLCLPTYECLNNRVVVSDTDSFEDCQPKKYPPCINGEERKADGTCTNLLRKQCELECGGNVTSELKGEYGICACDNLPDQELICDTECRQQLPSVFLNEDGSYEIIDNINSESVNIRLTGSNYLATVNCSSKCPVYSLHFSATGISGAYGVPTSLLNLYYSQTSRRLRVVSEEISNPMLCFVKGGTIIFSLESKNTFPEYLKDSLLNTNPHFDFGAFIELKWRMQSSQSNVDTFAFTFNEEGFYDLINKNSADQHVILKVVSDATECEIPGPTRRDLGSKASTVYFTRTESNIAGFGLSPMQNMILEPNWSMISGMIFTSFIVLLILIGLLAILHWHAWSTNNSRERIAHLLKDCCRRFRLLRPERFSPVVIEDDHDSIDLDRDLLEPSQFTEMLEKLSRYYIQLEAAFDSQDEDARQALEVILSQTKDLKALLTDRISDIDLSKLKAKVKIIIESSEEDQESIDVPEIIQVMAAEEFSIAMEVLKEAEASNKELLALEVYNKITGNKNLTEKAKEELLQDYDMNMQRIDRMLELDMDRAQNEINRRVEERIARRKAAEREKVVFEQKWNGIVSSYKKSKDDCDKELEIERNIIENECVEQRELIKRNARKEVDEKLMIMQIELQTNLANAKNQLETERLMKAFEIESRRIENKLLKHRKQQEDDLLKRLEDRRKEILDRIEGQAATKKLDLDAKSQKELEELEQRALLAIAKPDSVAEFQLAENEEKLIENVLNSYNAEIEELEERYQMELQSIDQDIQSEGIRRVSEKQSLEILLRKPELKDEKVEIMKTLEGFESSETKARADQEEMVNMRVSKRKEQRAEKKELLRRRHEAEINELELQKYNAEKELRSELELNKIEDLLQFAEDFTPEELVAMARELLETKHDREIANLTALKHSKLRERQDEAIILSLDRKAQDKLIEKSQFDSMREKIKRESLDPELKAAKLAELDAKALESESKIDYNFIVSMNTDQDRVWRETESDFKRRFEDLSAAQSQEIHHILSRIKGAHPRLLEANISDMQQEIDLQLSDLHIKHAEKLRDLDKRAQEIKEIEKQRVHEIEFINSQLKEALGKQRKIEQMHYQRQIMEERQQKVVDSMKERGISTEKMEEILNIHQKEMEDWEKAVENERIRQQKKLLAKLEVKKQKYNEKKAQWVQKFKMDDGEVKGQYKLKIVFDSGKEMKLWSAYPEIETKLRIPDFNEEQEFVEDVEPIVLDKVITKVKRVEEIAENIDTKQFNLLIKAISDVSDMMEAVKTKLDL